VDNDFPPFATEVGSKAAGRGGTGGRRGGGRCIGDVKEVEFTRLRSESNDGSPGGEEKAVGSKGRR